MVITAQVGPEMAEHLGIPQVTGALKVALGADGRLLVERENESSCQTLAVTLPAVVTVTKSEKEPRFASIKGKMKQENKAAAAMERGRLQAEEKTAREVGESEDSRRNRGDTPGGV